MAAVLTIYGRSDCRGCDALVRRAIRRGVPYRYVDLERDAGARAHVRALGLDELPIGEVGDVRFSGVRYDVVDALACPPDAPEPVPKPPSDLH